MGTNLNSNILGVKRAQELTQVTGNLNNIYNKSVAGQKEALSDLFTQKYFNSTTEKAKIDEQIKTLEAKIKEMEDKIEELEEKIEGKQEELLKVQADIADEVVKITRLTEETEAEGKRRTDDAVREATEDFEKNGTSVKNGGHLTFADFLRMQMNVVTGELTGDKNRIDALIEALSAPQSKLNSQIKGLEGLVGDIDSLNSQYGSTKSTLDLLKLTKENMTDAAGSYQSSDTDPSVPIFTPAKEDLADGYLAQYTSRMANREIETKSASAADKQEVIDKYKAQVKPQTAGADPYSVSNAQLKSFGEALNGGLLDDMQAAGFTKKDMLDTIKEIYPSIGISHGDDGRPVIPWGHGTEAKEIYTKFTDTFGAIEGKGQRDDLQVAEMDKAIKKDGIIGEMKDQGFTWKETAYTLTRLWPGGGMEYNLGEKEISLPIGDDKTKGTYDALEEQIKKNYPDVKINRGNTASDDTVSDENKRTDPVGFHVGDNSYEFVIDRNQDGVINDFSEMMGANGTDGMEELAMFDTDGDGHIKGDELENLLVLNTEHTNRDYEFLSAKQLGVKDIDLSSFEEKKQGRADGGAPEDFVNINNSLITGNFDITMNDNTKAEGYQKFVTEEYMKTVYDPILGENIYSELDGNTVDNIIDKNFKEADNELADLNEFADAVEAAKEGGDIKAALRTKANNMFNEVSGYLRKEFAENEIEFNTEFQKEKLEMSLKSADTLINAYIDEASDEAKKELEESRELDKDDMIEEEDLNQ